MDLQNMTKEDIRRELIPEKLQPTFIIHAALMAGPLLFFLVVLFLNYSGFTRMPARERGPDFEMTMLQIMAVLTLGAWIAAATVPNLMLKPERLKPLASAGNPVDWMLSHHRTVDIIRLSLLEGPALFGLVILITAALARSLDQNPFIWLSTVPLWVQLVVGLLTFPTRDSVSEFMDQRILKPMQKLGVSM